MSARETWLPPTVDELRTKTNPKITYNLDGYEGAPNYPIKNIGSIGAVEKIGQIKLIQWVRSIGLLQQETRWDKHYTHNK